MKLLRSPVETILTIYNAGLTTEKNLFHQLLSISQSEGACRDIRVYSLFTSSFWPTPYPSWGLESVPLVLTVPGVDKRPTIWVNMHDMHIWDAGKKKESLFLKEIKCRSTCFLRVKGSRGLKFGANLMWNSMLY